MALPKVPIVNWQPEDGYFKVVQLYVDDEPYMRFGKLYLNHGKILGDFLKSVGLPYEGEDQNEYPAMEGNRYKAVGMGLGLVDNKKRKVVLSDESIGYQIGISAKHAKKIRQLEQEWRITVLE